MINALIQKGILTTQEAEAIQAEVAAARPPVEPERRGTRRLSLGMRLQMQHAHLDTDAPGADPAPTSQVFLRRVYLTLEAGLADNWSATFTYDFANGGYDEAVVKWKPAPDLTFDFGLRKVNVAHEERASSGDIKAIERSSITRYFVEENDGRRLGAASYRVGLFADGSTRLSESTRLVYGAAVTNPVRSETFEDAADDGDAGSNRVAVWANLGLSGTLPRDGQWLAGVGAGLLPDQGGNSPEQRGRGFNLSLYSMHARVTSGRLGLLAEYLVAEVDRGAARGTDATPRGLFLQPSLKFSNTLEAVARYAWLDSDHRGVTLSDVIRSAPSGGTMNTATEWYAGANWYLQGNDLKLQLGAVYGKTRDTVDGAPDEAEAVGVRSQLQMQF